jgi:hypothetical protein
MVEGNAFGTRSCEIRVTIIVDSGRDSSRKPCESPRHSSNRSTSRSRGFEMMRCLTSLKDDRRNRQA